MPHITCHLSHFTYPTSPDTQSHLRHRVHGTYGRVRDGFRYKHEHLPHGRKEENQQDVENISSG